MRKSKVEFLYKNQNHGIKLARVNSILITKSIDSLHVNFNFFLLLGVRCDRKRFSELSSFIEKSMILCIYIQLFYIYSVPCPPHYLVPSDALENDQESAWLLLLYTNANLAWLLLLYNTVCSAWHYRDNLQRYFIVISFSLSFIAIKKIPLVIDLSYRDTFVPKSAIIDNKIQQVIEKQFQA